MHRADGRPAALAGTLRALRFGRRSCTTLGLRGHAVAYDEQLAQRIRVALGDDAAVTEKKMFGGVAFLRSGHMFAGVSNSSLVARVGKANYQASLSQAHVREMDFTGKAMRGYVFVDGGGLKTAEQLRFWLER